MNKNTTYEIGSVIYSFNSGLHEIASIDHDQKYYISTHGVAVRFSDCQLSQTKEENDKAKALKTAQIAKLNDSLRTNPFSSQEIGKVYFTPGIFDLKEEDQDHYKEVMHLISDYSDFQDPESDEIHENDPYGEHDFGCVTTSLGLRVFFKIDYYDRDSNYRLGSETPEDSGVTERVLTIYLASEH